MKQRDRRPVIWSIGSYEIVAHGIAHQWLHFTFFPCPLIPLPMLFYYLPLGTLYHTLLIHASYKPEDQSGW